MSYPQETFVHTKLLPNSLLSQRREAVASNTLLYQLKVLKDTGRYECFKLKWHPVYSRSPEVWPVPDHLFWDSDVAKWIEGACYLLHDHPNTEVDATVKELVDMIRSASEASADGYLNLHYTVVEPGRRFTNLRDMHELYNAGHMIEAALAHQQLYRNDLLMQPILRYVELLCATFGPSEHQIHGYPGHPEIELALLRLHERTKDSKHLALAEYFILERGNAHGTNGKHFFDVELEARGDDPYKRPSYHTEVGGCKWYYSAHLPIIDQTTMEGHSVRAMYLLTAAADLIRIKEQPKLKVAINRLWNNMVQCKMYTTGGIGAMKQYEGFGRNYYLPQGTDEGGCYAETCASIGVMMLAQRLLQYELNGRYGDILELCLYNNVLTAMSSDGKAFTYVNQLASSDSDLCKRSEWFTVACCPPNVLRILGQLGGYIYKDTITENKQAIIDVHLYIPSTLDFRVDGEKCSLTQEGNYPWEGRCKFRVDAPKDVTIALRLRIPHFAAKSWKLTPTEDNLKVVDGYLHLPPAYLHKHQSFELDLPLRPRLIAPHPYATCSDTLTLARGPIIYCVEDVDNPWVHDHFKSARINKHCLSGMQEQAAFDHNTGESYVTLKAFRGVSRVNVGEMEKIMAGQPFLISTENVKYEAPLSNGTIHAPEASTGVTDGMQVLDELTFVPFHYRANRGGKGHCRVGLKEG